ncbi:hypothetical protein SBC1_18430 [Caballeronia sp. SBC1]|nr:hypothetical protein SBC2_19810 [Caballeronia sp. SBC2]QIN61848.1 hypothetical protein SBC1_18430 [Caballeronia sp. SBC1]
METRDVERPVISVIWRLTCRGNKGGLDDTRLSHRFNHTRQFVIGRYGDVNVVGGYVTAPSCFVKLYRT